ncbi:MAG: carboxylesterase/lipase family protein [Pseudooceanicola sp.]
MSTEMLDTDTSGRVVETRSGRLEGVERNGVQVFRGVPYASPPVGPLRFRPPVPVAPWQGVRPAKSWPDSCPQEQREDFAPLRWYRSTMPQSEDCLHLNVFTPDTDAGKRPVMVWFHGGAFSTGAGTSPGFEGSALARRGDVVVVTVNHRLNVFGYFHPGPEAGGTFADSANAGLLDLVAALEWVRDNIAGFGGDPECVTIFGESGGGGKVGRLLAMPDAQGLYHRAILQSSGLRSTLPGQGLDAARHLLGQFGLEPGTAERIRDIPAERLLDARLKTVAEMGFDAFEPLPDGRALPEAPFVDSAPEISADIPIMIGTCEDEALYRLADVPGIYDLTREAAIDRLQKVSAMDPEGASAIYDLYAAKLGDAPPIDIYVDILTDQRFRMNTIRAAGLRAEQGRAPAYLYRFNWKSPVRDGRLKSIHTIEVPFVFGTMETAVELLGDGPELGPLSDLVMDAWVAFARNGDPNHSGLPDWAPYSTGDRGTMLLNTAPAFVSDPPGPELEALAAHRMPGGFRPEM